MAGGLVAARHRAQSAADLGALAGAVRAVEGAGVACPAAERIVRANGARMVACRVEGLDVVVTAQVSGPAGWGAAEQSARAGPERDESFTRQERGRSRKGGGMRRRYRPAMVRFPWDSSPEKP